MLYFISPGFCVNIPSLLFYHLRDNVRKTRVGSDRKKHYIPLGSLISYIIKENIKLEDLDEKYLDMTFGEPFNAANLVEMRILEKVSKPPKEKTMKVENSSKSLWFTTQNQNYSLKLMISFMNSNIEADHAEIRNWKGKCSPCFLVNNR